MRKSEKAGNAKPLLVAKFKAEARIRAGGVSENQRRFVTVALERGKELEPAGRLAGVRA
ncbi:MAG: hypothetical protein VYD45_14385 [Pseudomonadota bacterium]|nr:hypothetical protein [Pseudomonadota bacterium]